MDPYRPFREAASAYAAGMLKQLYGVEEEPRLETGGDIADFTYPCFRLAKTLRKSPLEIASALAGGAGSVSGTIAVSSKGGYLNMSADPVKLASSAVATANRMGDSYGKSVEGGGRMLVEHTSINPTGPMHIGRTRNAILGDTLTRSLRQAGMDISSEYYVNDVGRQVVVLYWGLKRYMAGDEGGKPDHELVRHYIRANQEIEKDEGAASEVRDIQQRLERGDAALIAETRKAAEMVLAGIRESLESINVFHDRFVFESELIKDGSVRRVVERLKALPSAAQEGGAWYLPLDGDREEDRFYFTRSDGTSLYTTRDVAYHMDKLSRAGRLVDVLGEDQKLGMKYLVRTLEMLGESHRIDFLFHSFVSLEEGKMSTRQGVGVLLDDVVREAKERALREVLSRRPELPGEEAEAIAAAVGIGAVRYNIVRLQAEKKIIFRWEEALNFEGSSAPFVQYSHARACSILSRAGEWNCPEPTYEEENELRLARQIALFPSVLRDVAGSMAVHRVATYAQQVAAEFNQFYRVVPVLKAPESRIGSRLALVSASKIAIGNALRCMGIAAPESM